MRDLLRAALLLVAGALIVVFFLFAVISSSFGDPTGYVLLGGGLLVIGAVSVVVALSRRDEGQPQPLPEGQIRCHMCGAIAPAAKVCSECGANLTAPGSRR